MSRRVASRADTKPPLGLDVNTQRLDHKANIESQEIRRAAGKGNSVLSFKDLLRWLWGQIFTKL